ncbi:MAG: hypothetical protein WCI71_07910 [Bacteroidota bacterium]
MIHIILHDKGKKYQSFDHDPKYPEKDVHKLKQDIYADCISSGKIGKKAMEIYGRNCDLGISDGEIVLKSRINKRKILNTGINAEDFFNLLFFMLEEINIFDKKQNRNISWNELKSIMIKEERKEKLSSLPIEPDEDNKDEGDAREIIFEIKARKN